LLIIWAKGVPYHSRISLASGATAGDEGTDWVFRFAIQGRIASAPGVVAAEDGKDIDRARPRRRRQKPILKNGIQALRNAHGSGGIEAEERRRLIEASAPGEL
jgi:hypothetical protein